MLNWMDRHVDAIYEIPWWGNALIAIGFAMFAWIGVPYFGEFFPGVESWLGVVAMVAWISAFIFFCGAVCTAVIAKRRGELFKDEVSIGTIKLLSWLQFEDFVAELFRRRGYEVKKCGGTSPDGGIDLRVWKDGELTLVQCKQSRFQRVGVKAVREMLGVVVVEKARMGFVIATEGFTREAWEFAGRTDRIKLFTGTDLLKVVRRIREEEGKKAVPSPTAPICEHLTAMVDG